MTQVPFIGRLRPREYLALFGSFILVIFEAFIRIITLALPQPIIKFCYKVSRNLFNRLSSTKSKQARAKRKTISSSIANCSDFTELCGLFGYYAEEHIVQTGDGYLLGVHRLPFKKGEEQTLVNAGPASTRKPVVYLHHGLMMNSDIWVCMTEEERCLPFALVNHGYDVWLGNNRGNKYSKKSVNTPPTTGKFWDFSMDEFAFHDIPNTIDYVLKTTLQSTLSYVGFSQGTAQAFAALAIHPGLNEKVNVFIALAPAMSPAGLSNGIVDSLVKASPDVLFLIFGRKSLLSSATMWQSILYPPIFVRLIDASLGFLFAWHGKNISAHQKLAAYPHLYSFTSTKSVVHWFQIIRNKSFQMYDDDASNAFSIGASNRYYKVAKFPTKNIKTPVVLVYGGNDSLVDIRVMLKELPRHTMAFEIPHFEHLDFLWAQEVDKLVHPHVFEALRHYAVDRVTDGLPKGLNLSIMDTANFHRRNNSGSLTQSEDEAFASDYDGTNEIHTPSKSYAQQMRARQYANKASLSNSPTMNWVEWQRRDTLDPHDTVASPPRSSHQNGEAPISTPLENVVNSNTLTEIPKSSSPQDGDKHSDGGRTSPASIPTFGSKGISVGTSRPSVGPAQP